MYTNPAEIIGWTGLDQHDTGLLNQPGLPSFMELVHSAIAGQLDLSFTGLVNVFLTITFQELLVSGYLMRQLLVIAILGALMSVLTEAFTHKGANETGFYVTYIMAAALAISSFYVAVDVLTSLVARVDLIMTASIPMIMGLMTMGGNFLGAAGFQPLLFSALHIMSWFVGSVFVPLVLASAGLDIASRLSGEGAKLDMLADITAKVASWTLKGIVAVFIFLLTIQRVTAPILTNVALQTSRNVVGAVPVVGDAFTAAMDTVINFSGAARSGVLVALVLVLCGALIAPLIKIIVLAGIYRLVAAFLQPVADKRLVGMMECVGKHLGLMFQAAGLVGVMCIYTVILLLSF